MLLGFKKRFTPKIQSGIKGFTLRNKPKRKPKLGEILHMYSGLQTKNCELITRQFILQSILSISVFIKYDRQKVNICIEGYWLTAENLELFFIGDGFENKADFIDYWTESGKHKRIDAFDKQMFVWNTEILNGIYEKAKV